MLAVPLAGHADNAVVAAGDSTTVISNSTIDFGTVCVGSATQRTVSVAIKRNGNYDNSNVFKNGTTAEVTADVSGSGYDSSFVEGNEIAIPGTWENLGNNVLTAPVTSLITLNASVVGPSTGSVTFTSTGTKANGSGLTVKSEAIALTASVISCDEGPSITVDDVTLEGNTLGGRTLEFGDVGVASDAQSTPAVTCFPAIGSLLSLGTTEVTCAATDSAGQTTQDSGTVTIVDTTGPVITGTPGSTTVEATSAAGAPYTWAEATASDVVWGSLAVDCSPASGSIFALGATSVTCTATDGSNNSQTTPFQINVADTTKPDFPQPSDITAEATSAEGAVVTFTPPVATDAVSGEIIGTCTPSSGAMFPLGLTTVTCTASDGSDNVGETSFVVTVADTTAPELTVPGNITAEATSPSGAVVSFTATATDAVSVPVVTCSPESGDIFPLATTTVSCTAIDDAGNASAAQTFTVTVEDTTPPTLESVPESFTVEGNTLGGALTSFTMPTATDTVDAEPLVTCDNPSLYPLGETVVTCTAKDARGNRSTASFSITVVDTTAPSISWRSTEPVPNAHGWHNDDVTVVWECLDIVHGEWTVEETVTGEGSSLTATGTCADGSLNATSDTKSGIMIDRTAPLLDVSGPADGATVDLCTAGSTTKPTFAPSDVLSGVDPATMSEAWAEPSAASGVGTYSYTASASDKADNTASETRTYSVVYGSGAWGGFRQPINMDGLSRFKLGSTVPVKFRLDCDGTPISTAVAKLYVKRADGVPNAGVDEAVSTAASTTGNLFRYSDGQYIFNLSTKAGYTNPGSSTVTAFTTGTWTLTAVLDDGSKHSVTVQLAK
nr:HYR domain-containing protein [Tessaracoccus sp. ZS01]